LNLDNKMTKSTIINMRKQDCCLAVMMILLIMGLITPAYGDNYLQVAAAYNDGRDTVGRVEHFVEFGEKIPVFIPPYTIHFRIFPLTDSTFSVKADFFELGPDYSFYRKETTATQNEWQTIESLPSKGILFDYSFAIAADTISSYNVVPVDSLTIFESVHYKAYIWRDTYADYKWQARSGYLENIFDRYRKELGVTRAGKADFYIYPGSNNSPYIDNFTGIGYDIAGHSLYAVFNKDFDSALPQTLQRFVIYDTWGYSPRFLAVGFSRFYLDDIYLAREYVKKMPLNEIESIFNDEYPEDIESADILSGAFVKFLIDKHGLASFRKLYDESSPGSFAFDNNYQKGYLELLEMFIEYEKNLKLDESNASYFNDFYSSQMWFDKALKYGVWLASQPILREYHIQRLGATYFQLGNYAQSESSYASLVNLQPDNEKAKYLLGLSYIRNGKTDKGMKKLESVIDSFPDAAKMLAEIYLDQNRNNKAGEMLDIIKGVPDSWTAILKSRLALALDDTAKADTLLNISLTLNNNVIALVPSEARGYLGAAYTLMFMGLFEDAENRLQIALFIENRPYYLAQANLEMGRLFDLKGDHQTAVEYYNKVLELESGIYMNKLAEKQINKPFKLK